MNYLIEYQKSRKLTPDGVVGKNTSLVMMKELNILSTKRFAMFMAQLQHESANFTAGRENLNYGAAALMSTFKKYFSSAEEAALYARKPIKIANRVYANRMGNGSEASGDGWNYRGGGAIQITGKDNYNLYFKSRGLVPEITPTDHITYPEHYFAAGKWFFDVNGIWKYCETVSPENVLRVSRMINLGNVNAKAIPLGYEERLALSLKLNSNLA